MNRIESMPGAAGEDRIAVLILAGGEGRRIDGSKPLRRIGATTLLDRALDFAHSWSDLVAVAVRHAGQSGATTELIDTPGIAGPLAGLAAGLRFVQRHRRKFLLTIPCDMPFLPEDLAFRLEDTIGDAAAAVAASGGFLHPVCALWRGETLDVLPEYLASGRRSLNGFAKQAGFVTVEWLDAPNPFFNVNTPEDLAAAERRIAG